jgi:hypothetical protein
MCVNFAFDRHVTILQEADMVSEEGGQTWSVDVPLDGRL